MITDEQAKTRIAYHVKRLLRLRGMSQSDLADATRESAMRISLYCNAKKMPGVAVLARICYALDATVDEVLEPMHGRGKNSA